MQNSGNFARSLMATSVSFILFACIGAEAQNVGHFEGNVQVEWMRSTIGKDRDMKLLNNFSFVDGNGKRWDVPKGAVINGASIPRGFWTFVGPPFVGKYREASVVHDYFCETKSQPWKDVHRIFYYASLAGGVSKIKARVMYGAVYAGGPRWGSDRSNCSSQCHGTTAWVPSIDDDNMAEIVKWIEDTNPSLERIEVKVDKLISGPHSISPLQHTAPLLRGIPKEAPDKR